MHARRASVRDGQERASVVGVASGFAKNCGRVPPQLYPLQKPLQTDLPRRGYCQVLYYVCQRLASITAINRNGDITVCTAKLAPRAGVGWTGAVSIASEFYF